jgi:NitT/TauT family transport system substrate-binding protein
VLAGSADAGLTWEPNISVGQEREPNLTTIYNVGADYQKNAGITVPYFGFALRNEAELRHPGVSARIAAAMEDCIRGVVANVDEAVALSADKMKVPPAALKNAFASKRLTFNPVSMSNQTGRDVVMKAAEYLVQKGVLEKPIGSGFLG